MPTVKVEFGQTLPDIAVQELGDATRVMEIAVLNNLNVTDDLISGSLLTVPDYDLSKRGTVNIFRDKANHPACWISPDEEQKQEGIGYWYLENDFVVQ